MNCLADSTAGAAAIPPITASKAGEWRGRDGPTTDIEHRFHLILSISGNLKLLSKSDAMNIHSHGGDGYHPGNLGFEDLPS
jgi:hypothetical protein